MAMGTRRKREKQQDLWIATNDVVETPANVFYDRLNQILDEQKFDAKVERLCRKFYKKSTYGRPSVAPGVYFRCLLIGYFEGLDSERGIAWRIADSLSLRKFLGYALDETTPDHSTISRTRRLFWLETHKAVFGWVLRILTKEGLVSGRTVSIDATTLEANAALKSIVRRDNGQSYNEYLKELAKAAGMENPTREQLARLDRKRHSHHFPQDQRKIEPGAVHQQPLEDVISPSQMDSPHTAGIVQMREASLGQFAPQLLQPLVALSSHSPPILVRPLLLFRLPLALPFPPAPLRFRDVTPDFLIVHFLQYGTAMIALNVPCLT